MEAGGELDLATKAEVLLDALTQQISARKHQLQTEQLNWENLYEDARVHSAVKRVVREVPSKHHPVRSSAFSLLLGNNCDCLRVWAEHRGKKLRQARGHFR